MSIRKFVYGSLFVALFTLGCGADSEDTNDVTPKPPVAAVDSTFTNPLLASGPDPWVVHHGSFYYYTHTMGNRIGIYRTQYISQLSKASNVTIWTAPATGAYSRNVWAPEIHRINNKWYVYFAADDGNDANHRMYVLENPSDNPLSGTWTFKGKISDPSDKWAIDGSVFEHDSKLYFIWSGWEGTDPNANSGRQQIYIAKMSNPWTIEGERIMISRPTYTWERNGLVNEGPEVLKNKDGNPFLVYSASGCWTDSYSLGMLTLKENGDPLKPEDWVKSTNPVFSTKAESSAFGPGHNGFFKSPDSKEDWIIYHANPLAGQGCADKRSPRIQKINWRGDGTPDFGEPVNINTKIKRPSGEIK
ncbi:family 43 glycosylhydrolase [Sabulibacter ruber]|uniref:glycoside hydrolase family 43 protein n=1 Tax=Sabulibacter ruber TaxID=2811901 RepID=UPI001A975DE4|nr:glycoside hydrolase family 43 protein [Sabulibacter ruber]